MECLNCRSRVSEGSKYCTECGTPVPAACPSCGLGNPHQAKFCANCGTKLTGFSPTPAGGSALPAPVSGESSAERRQLTVMFSDLVGSTALSALLDAEDLSRVIADFRTACTNAVTPFGGSVAKYMGDGALIYFGYPEAFEDAPARAILAGLALVEATGALRQSSPNFPPLRIGVATGTVVVGELIGEGASQERVAVGETLNLAARLQSVAAPNSVVISESTWTLAGRAFSYHDLGPQILKGISAPTRAFTVLGENTEDKRQAATGKGATTPLVGRADEISMMRQRWKRALEGDGQAILLSAPAGMGKSRWPGVGRTTQPTGTPSPVHAPTISVAMMAVRRRSTAGSCQRTPASAKSSKLAPVNPRNFDCRPQLKLVSPWSRLSQAACPFRVTSGHLESQLCANQPKWARL